ncbi:MAG: hypothetical protein ABI855_05760 [Bacteroidota bacterium]
MKVVILNNEEKNELRSFENLIHFAKQKKDEIKEKIEDFSESSIEHLPYFQHLINTKPERVNPWGGFSNHYLGPITSYAVEENIFNSLSLFHEVGHYISPKILIVPHGPHINKFKELINEYYATGNDQFLFEAFLIWKEVQAKRLEAIYEGYRDLIRYARKYIVVIKQKITGIKLNLRKTFRDLFHFLFKNLDDEFRLNYLLGVGELEMSGMMESRKTNNLIFIKNEKGKNT